MSFFSSFWKRGERESEPARKSNSSLDISYKKGELIHSDIGMAYRVFDIKSGGMGIVYIVQEQQTGRLFALKTLQHQFQHNEDMQRRFFLEAETWTRLGKHPNIVRAEFIDRLRGSPCVVMEYVSPDYERRVSLRDWLRQEPLSIQKSIEWAIQCCDGMWYARQKVPELVHRDLKPDNLLIATQGVAKVTDFGLVRVADQASREEMDTGKIADKVMNLAKTREGIVGTPPYMAPEQWLGQTVDTRTDIYAVGAMLYEMLVDRFVFPAQTVEEFGQCHLQQIPVHPIMWRADIPKSLNTIVMTCLEKDPKNRVQDFGELRAKLDTAYNELTGQSVRVLRGEELETWELANQAFSFAQLGLQQEAKAQQEEALRQRTDFWDAFKLIIRGELHGNEYDREAIKLASTLAIDFDLTGLDKTEENHFRAALHLLETYDERMAFSVILCLVNFQATSQTTEALSQIDMYIQTRTQPPLGEEMIQKAAKIVLLVMTFLDLPTAVLFYKGASAPIRNQIEVLLGGVSPRALDVIKGTSRADMPQVRLMVHVINLMTFLQFLHSIGFRVTPTGHDLFSDNSEGVSLELGYKEAVASVLDIRYIDNHFWPKKEKETALPTKFGEVKWQIVVRPVAMILLPGVNIPSQMVNALQNYSDELPNDPEARKAYEQYLVHR